MTQIAALATALLRGDVVSIKTAFDMFGCSNAPREIGRSIERKFGVIVSKTPTKFTSRYGKSGVYFKYRLNKTEYNKEGIQKMKEYVAAQKNATNPKTTKELKQMNLL